MWLIKIGTSCCSIPKASASVPVPKPTWSAARCLPSFHCPPEQVSQNRSSPGSYWKKPLTVTPFGPMTDSSPQLPAAHFLSPMSWRPSFEKIVWEVPCLSFAISPTENRQRIDAATPEELLRATPSRSPRFDSQHHSSKWLIGACAEGNYPHHRRDTERGTGQYLAIDRGSTRFAMQGPL